MVEICFIRGNITRVDELAMALIHEFAHMCGAPAECPSYNRGDPRFWFVASNYEYCIPDKEW